VENIGGGLMDGVIFNVLEQALKILETHVFTLLIYVAIAVVVGGVVKYFVSAKIGRLVFGICFAVLFV
jgi:hypothetical protein